MKFWGLLDSSVKEAFPIGWGVDILHHSHLHFYRIKDVFAYSFILIKHKEMLQN